MKTSTDYSLCIFGKTYVPTEVKYNTKKNTHIILECVAYTITKDDMQFTLFLDRERGDEMWSFALTKQQMTVAEFRQSDSIGAPLFHLMFALLETELEEEIEKAIVTFDNADYIQSFMAR